MSVSINLTHPKNEISTSSSDYLYKFVGNEESNNWTKISSNFFLAYTNDYDDYEISDEEINPSDYIITYNNITNHLSYTENFTNNMNDSLWKLNNIYINKNKSKKISFLTTEAYEFHPTYSRNEHCCLYQECQTSSTEYLKFSVFVAINDSLIKPNISLSLCSKDKNYGAYAKFNFTDITAKPIEYLTDSYKEYTTSIDTNFKSKIELVEEYSDKQYKVYKVSIIGKFSTPQITICKFNILDNNENYYFTSDNNIYLNVSGFQLEKCNTINNIDTLLEQDKPYVYNNTQQPITKKYYDGLYIVENNDDNLVPRKLQDNKPHFIVKESDINNLTPIVGDIAIIADVLSFKTFINNEYKNVPVKFGSKCDTLNDDLYTIYYDKELKTYRMKVYENVESGSSLKTVKYENITNPKSKSTAREILYSLLYNQGYFETWSKPGKCVYKHGFNTGGGHNFWK